MAVAASLPLDQLLAASDSLVREAAWEKLILGHTRLLIAVARSFGGGHDEAMERYSYILEKLRDSDFRRLRSFEREAGASFSTWLTVASRRLCLDYHRIHYGRHRAITHLEDAAALRSVRRSIEDCVASKVDADSLCDPTLIPGDAKIVLAERNAALRGAVMQLAPRERFLLALRFQDELSASRIGQILGLPTPFHVYRQVNAILGKLRIELEARGINSSDG